MRVWTRLDQYRARTNRPLILALGNFDGVHLGHQQILETLVDRARRQNGIPAVLTFAEHPQRVLHHSPDPPLLTSPQHRLFLFQERGIEVCFLLHFTLAFSKTKPEDFVGDWLVQKLGVKEVHLGYNAHFGFGRKGDCRLMKKLSEQFHFDFHEAVPVKKGEEFISSTLIRRLILEGKLDQARQYLGRPFSIFASVVRGSGRGRNLGFPTANLRPHSEILPPRGVYPVEVRENLFHLKDLTEGEEFEYQHEKPQEWIQGVLNYGSRPTFDSQKGEIPEVFLFDYSGDLYGKTLEVLFHPRLRGEKKFPNPEELVRAIEKDIVEARRHFAMNTLQKG